MGTEWLRKIGTAIGGKQNSVFTYPVDKQKAFIAHFPEPKDGIERGYFQYCCRMKLYGEPLHLLMNLAAFPLSLYYLATYKDVGTITEQAADAVFFPDGKPFNIIPDSLLGRYENLVSLSSDDKTLTKEDRQFLKAIFHRHPFSWMLWLKLIIKVAQYSHAITKYKPQAIISCNEFSYTAPILTEYCHTRGVKLINVMHGEKLYDMHDAFAKYDEFYVWDQAYVDLFASMRCDAQQFVIERPQSLRIQNAGNIEKKYDYTYYLTAETDEELEIIAEKLKVLQERGKRISVRPHPRYSNMSKVKEFFSFANVENWKAVTIEESLLQTDAAISLHSTVLYQAYNNGIRAIIDDISAPKQFAKLKELGYVMLSVEHRLLSELLEDVR